MKDVFLFCTFSLCVQMIFAQTTPKSSSNSLSGTKNTKLLFVKESDTIALIKNSSHEFTTMLSKSFTSQVRVNGDTDRVPVIKGYKTTYLYEKKGKAYFKYWRFREATSSAFNTYNSPDASDPTKEYIFSMDVNEYENITRQIYKRFKGFSAGAYTVPFRLRGIGGDDNFDFESSLSLQANFIVGFGSKYNKESWFDASFGLGLTEINLTEKNSDVAAPRTASAFTFSFGGVIKAAQFVNVGIFIGMDNLGRADSDVNWRYEGDLWVGMGINVSFNKLTTNSSPKATEQNVEKVK
ncbi:hypothetical protein [Zobellia uliginosa]|uniref:hypothetical protein n=1 Tax=Zobellia uliginosa TaxID=143224 RepID=UPI001C076CFC|nr:hypothetical protein [Zobellia uliginosa]MBU2947373.1 hypothetical protein [Zobellia uliginosa]